MTVGKTWGETKWNIWWNLCPENKQEFADVTVLSCIRLKIELIFSVALPFTIYHYNYHFNEWSKSWVGGMFLTLKEGTVPVLNVKCSIDCFGLMTYVNICLSLVFDFSLSFEATYQVVVDFTLSPLHVSLLCSAQRQSGEASQLFLTHSKAHFWTGYLLK